MYGYDDDEDDDDDAVNPARGCIHGERAMHRDLGNIYAVALVGKDGFRCNTMECCVSLVVTASFPAFVFVYLWQSVP